MLWGLGSGAVRLKLVRAGNLFGLTGGRGGSPPGSGNAVLMTSCRLIRP